MEPTKSFSAGDEILSADLNGNFTEALNNYRDFTLGENITANLPVYLKASDGKIYRTSSSADSEIIHSFVGFLKEAGSTNDVKKVQVSGKVSGLSGLTAGSKVYLADATGTYSHTAGTYEKLIGVAVSTTALILRVASEGTLTQKAQTITGVKTFGSIPVLPASDPTTDNQATRKAYVDTKDTFIVGDYLLKSSDAVAYGSTDSYTKKKEIQVFRAGTYRVKFTLNENGGTTGRGRIYKNGVAFGIERTATTTPTEYSEDLLFAVGDLIQIYLIRNSGVDYVMCSIFRLYVGGYDGATVNLD